jgi:hypothetical protein
VNEHKRFLKKLLESGLGCGTVTPADIVRHLTPDVLAHNLPVKLRAKLVEAALAAEKMTPELVVDVIGVEALAEHAPAHLSWAAVAECARRSLGGAAAEAPAARSSTASSASGASKSAASASAGSSSKGSSSASASAGSKRGSLSSVTRLPTGSGTEAGAGSTAAPAKGKAAPGDEDTGTAGVSELADFEIVEETHALGAAPLEGAALAGDWHVEEQTDASALDRLVKPQN